MLPEPAVRVRWNPERQDWKHRKIPSTRASVLRAHSDGHGRALANLGTHYLPGAGTSPRQQHGSISLTDGRPALGRLPPREPVHSVRAVTSPRRARRAAAAAAADRPMSGRGGAPRSPRAPQSPRARGMHGSEVGSRKLASLRQAGQMISSAARMIRSTDSALSRGSRASTGNDDGSGSGGELSPGHSTDSDEPHSEECDRYLSAHEHGSTTPDIHRMLGPSWMSPASLPRRRASGELAASRQLGGDRLATGGRDERQWRDRLDSGSSSRSAFGAAPISPNALNAMNEIASLRERLRSANGESREGNHKQASVLLEESISSMHSQSWMAKAVSPRAHSNMEALRAVSAVRAGDYSTARKAAATSVQIDASNPRAHASLAKSEQIAGNLGQSARAIHAALEREPCHAEYVQGADEAHDAIRFTRFYRNELNRKHKQVRYRRRSDDVRTPTPEPPPTPEPQKKELDEAWKFLDLFDIFEAQHELRQAILGVFDDASRDADGDGEGDNRVSKRDKFAILQFIQRGTFSRKQVKHIEAVLDADDATLNPPAQALLQGMLPPEIAQDHAKMIEMFDEKQGFIKTIFRYYAVEGAVGMSEIDTMGVQQFAGFCKECHIKLGSKTEIDRIFIRANRDNTPAILKQGRLNEGRPCSDTHEYELLKHLQPGREEWQREHPLDSKHMNTPEFVAALVRLAVQRYPQEPSVAGRVEMLFAEHIDGNACCSTEGDAVSEVLVRPEIIAVFAAKAHEVEAKFDELRMADNEDNHDEFQCSTINMDAYMDFNLGAGIVGKEFTAKDARRIFVKVNIDDELFQNTAANEFDSADGLTLDEFQECLVRIVVELECKTLGGENAEEQMDGATVHFDINPAQLAPILDAFVGRTCQLAQGQKKKKKKK